MPGTIPREHFPHPQIDRARPDLRHRVDRPLRDRLARRALEEYGDDERVMRLAAQSAIVARVGLVMIGAWLAGYRAPNRHPSLMKQDLAIAWKIRSNDALGRDPPTNADLEQALGLTTQNVKTSLEHLQAIRMIRRESARGGWTINVLYLVSFNPIHFNRIVRVMIGGGLRLLKLMPVETQRRLLADFAHLFK